MAVVETCSNRAPTMILNPSPFTTNSPYMRTLSRSLFFISALLLSVATYARAEAPAATPQNANQNGVPLDIDSTAKAPPGAVFGKWQVLCPEPEPCRVAQSVVFKDSQEPILVARFYREKPPQSLAAVKEPADKPKSKDKDKKDEKLEAAGAVGVFTLPLGIFLAPGFALKIDQGKVRRFPYETCDSKGCHLGIKVDKALLSEMNKGTVATVQFYDAQQTAVVLNLPLDGFRQAQETLK